MTQARDVHIVFTHDEPTYRIVVRARLRPRTRRQQRLAARRAGTAHSFKREWRESCEHYEGTCLPISYEAFARGRRHFSASVKWQNLQVTERRSTQWIEDEVYSR